jgi:hypothetical protein
VAPTVAVRSSPLRATEHLDATISVAVQGPQDSCKHARATAAGWGPRGSLRLPAQMVGGAGAVAVAVAVGELRPPFLPEAGHLPGLREEKIAERPWMAVAVAGPARGALALRVE